MFKLRYLLFITMTVFLAACSQSITPDEEPAPSTVVAPTNVAVAALDNGSLQITWEHTGNADSFVIYRDLSTTALQSQAFTKLADVAKDVRQFDDTAVQADYSYKYQVVAVSEGKESAKTEQAGEAVSPKTPSPNPTDPNPPTDPSDDQDPTVSLVSSSASVTSASSITLTASASDNVGVTKVAFYRGDTKLSEDTSAPYEATVALSAADNGTLSFTAKAYDAASNVATSSAVTVSVNISTEPPAPLVCTGSATYNFSFTAQWDATTHPYEFPPNPHFSGFIGATHNDSVNLWKTGTLASAGIQQVAETGNKTNLTAEINAAIALGSVDELISQGPLPSVKVGDKLEFSFTATPEHSVFSIVSMIAPSPDWFVGLSGTELCQNGEWVDSFSRDAFAYDSGTDSGTSYTSANLATSPAVQVFRISEQPFNLNPSVGVFNLTKQ